MTKVCSKCKQTKPATEFYLRKSSKDGLSYKCKSCTKEYQKKINKTRTSEFRRGHQLKQRYNMTIEEYDKLSKKQDGLCAICGKVETAKNQAGDTRAMAVDHNHETGEVRQLLCSRCNVAIGLLEDSIKLCESAAKYLKKHNKN